jgi:hypothetical protein
MKMKILRDLALVMGGALMVLAFQPNAADSKISGLNKLQKQKLGAWADMISIGGQGKTVIIGNKNIRQIDMRVGGGNFLSLQNRRLLSRDWITKNGLGTLNPPHNHIRN